ncbi:hypothetical protein [Kitasatospora sp. NPDC101183]|uniref:hypothetical protein n=1 Tax=Kitasatospora sp. NPDC101183 TaxID=3364100 RepID=UPI0038209028
MGYDTTLIDAATVTKAASEVQATSENGRRNTLMEDATAAGAGHPGWKASTAAAACVRAWQVRLRREADEIEAAARALAASAHSYVTTDRALADALTGDAARLRGA